ncbi:MAG: cation:proton antiporter [Lachnospiraceae bacterium]
MEWLEWLQFIIGSIFLCIGLFLFAVEVFGAFRFDFVMNRMHASAIGDTLGIGISLIGLIIFWGININSLKFLLVIVFLWLSSPVSSHLIGRFEVTVNDNIGKHCTIEKDSLEE